MEQKIREVLRNIDAKYVLEENFRTKEAITALMEKLAKEAGQPL